MGISYELMKQTELIGYVVCTLSTGNLSFIKDYVYKVEKCKSSYNEKNFFNIYIEKDSFNRSGNALPSRYFKIADCEAIKRYRQSDFPVSISDGSYPLLKDDTVATSQEMNKLSTGILKKYTLKQVQKMCEEKMAKTYENGQTRPVIIDYLSKFNPHTRVNKSNAIDASMYLMKSLMKTNDDFYNCSLPSDWGGYIKKGDILKCVNSSHFRDKGNGWQEGKVFKVDKIENFYDDTVGGWHYIFFDNTKVNSVYTQGVYFRHLRPLKSKTLMEHINSNKDNLIAKVQAKNSENLVLGNDLDFMFEKNIIPIPTYYENTPVIENSFIEGKELANLNIKYYE